jgi:hypothetical protein
VTQRQRARIRRRRVAGLLVVIASIGAALGFQSLASSTVVSIDVHRSEHREPGRERLAAPDETDGALDPDLLEALRQAEADAGIDFVIQSGRRSPEHQAQLLREAVAKYGSEAEAARWVATPETSPHVSGDAVDIGPVEAAAWLSEHGAGYGLCQIYGNEPWHYELRPDAVDQGCPPMYADPTYDPRMQQ